MKKALRRNRKAVADRVRLSIKFSLPVICRTAKLKAVKVAGYDALIIGLAAFLLHLTYFGFPFELM